MFGIKTDVIGLTGAADHGIRRVEPVIQKLSSEIDLIIGIQGVSEFRFDRGGPDPGIPLKAVGLILAQV